MPYLNDAWVVRVCQCLEKEIVRQVVSTHYLGLVRTESSHRETAEYLAGTTVA